MQRAHWITRQKHGKGFSYYDNGYLVTDASAIAYYRSLAVPPAWREVRIAVSRDAKVLATGIDGAGRRQSIYHPRFRARQEAAKFERILQFGQRLPRLRRRIQADLARKKLSKDKVLACVVKLMDEAYFRIGNEQYAKSNGHYGLTTLRSKHADIRTTSVTFDFVGKSGQKHHKRISDRQLARIIKQLDELPGAEIFKYVDNDGVIHDIGSKDVNEYIKQHMGDVYSAKDFRTWGGTLLAAAELAAIERAESERERKKLVTATIRSVAKRLGNTPAVTRSSYVDPRIIKAFGSDDLSRIKRTVEKIRPPRFMKPEERFVLQLLRKAG